MSAWGTAIFSDDLAADLRGEFRHLIGDGLSPGEATQHLQAEYAETLTDQDEGPVFWLALAATQWKLGRLQDAVREQALEVIESGSDLARWQGSDRKKREKVLEQLAEQLNSPQPAAKKIRKRFRDFTEWDLHEAIGYTLASGQKCILRVVGFWEDRGGRYPRVEVLDWKGEEFPETSVLGQIPPRKEQPRDKVLWLLVCRTSERQLPVDRLERLGVANRQQEVISHPNAPYYSTMVVLWPELDTYLSTKFNLR